MVGRLKKWMRRQIKKKNSELKIKTTDYVAWIQGHTDWTPEKKYKYLATGLKQIRDPKPENYIGAFKVMAKNGEEYVTLTEKLISNILEDEASRPRAISDPSWQYCGIATWLQNILIFPILKDIMPGFVHGLSCHDMTTHFENSLSHIQFSEEFKSLSFDGAAFDANQHRCIQEVADKGLWEVFEPIVERRIRKWMHKDAVLQCLRQFWTSFQAVWFLTQPEFKDRFSLTKEERSLYNKCWSDKKASWSVCLTLEGSTFSGHPTLTTLGNTFRSLTYMWWYLEEAGLPDSWEENQKVVCLAAGDDSVMLIKEEHITALSEAVKKKTASSKKQPNIGLGQCIDEHKIFISHWRHFDFCSKWCFFDGSQWCVTRDYSKVIWNKQDYTGSNSAMRADKSLHTAAILAGLKAEGVEGSALYMLVEQRHLQHTPRIEQQQLDRARKIWLKEHSWDRHYESHQMSQENLASLDRRLGLSIWNIGQIVTSGQIEVNL